MRADIQAWAAEIGRAASQLASQARAAAEHTALVVWAQALVVALALSAAWALLRLQQQRRPPHPAPGAQPLDVTAVQPHLLALNQALAMARRGQPGRAAGLSALEAQRLAEQVETAAQALRRLIDRPAAAAAAAPADQAGGRLPPH
ncbi:MAG: hypothetical protein QE285_14020 [Aquabacterium sp.]|nr:hypothetical protein [Aquabacterium sp.]